MSSSDHIELCLSPVLSLDAYWVRFISLLDSLLTDYARGRAQRKTASETGLGSRRPGHRSCLRMAIKNPMKPPSDA
ncbi:hypothetical protein A4X13_0g4039 [Tilletia indica]|uniref:Uncharacterized protein n=1 Tax=Tilletia indica TaxID=43049 RepID=A0A177TX50_9BASI|nr:hypothetical protein A4X13_0g4039 [Tilletia indica]